MHLVGLISIIYIWFMELPGESYRCSSKSLTLNILGIFNSRVAHLFLPPDKSQIPLYFVNMLTKGFL